MRNFFATGAAALAAAVTLGAQQTRDQAAIPSAPGALVAGVIVAADTGMPVRGARIAIVGPALPDARVSLTDENGAFVFPALPAGRYHLWASRSGFATASFGEKRLGSGLPGRPIVLAANQRVEKLRFELPRGASLGGLVTDAFGEPAAGATVMVQRLARVAGQIVLLPAGVSFVDDRGGYRVFSLAPGDYVVSAVHQLGMSLSDAFVSGAVSGDQRTTTNVPKALLSIGRPPNTRPALQNTVTYFPSVTSVAQAGRVALAAGEDQSGINIRLQQGLVARVSGIVHGAEAVRSGGQVTLLPADADVEELSNGIRIGGTSPLAPGGTFKIDDVAPGQYTLTVLGRGGPDGASEMFFALQPLAVSGANIDGLVVQLQSAITVAGSISTDDGSELEQVSVVLMPVETLFRTGPQLRFTGPARAGQFAVSAVLPGSYRLEIISPAAGDWSIESAIFNGRDAMDFLLQIKPDEKYAGRLVLTKREAEIAGTLHGASLADANYTIVVFAAEERFWIPGGGRRNVAVQPDEAGRFRVRNLPAGTYRIAVLEDYDSAAGLYADLLRSLAGASPVVTLAPGQRIVQDLRVK